MDYFIKTHKEDSKCLILLLLEYEAIRNLIIKYLLTIYESLDYKDADWRHYELIIVGNIGHHRCTHCFHAGEWVNYYRNGSLTHQIGKRLDWGVQQIERMGDLTILDKRLTAKEPVTATTVFW